MKKSKLFIWGIVPLMAALAACGGGTSSVEPTSEGNQSSTNAGGASSGVDGETKTVEINFWHTCGQTIVDNLEQKIEDFSKKVLEKENVKVNVKLTYQGGYDDILDNIEKGFSAGNVPTIAVAYPDHVADYLNDEGNEPGKYVCNLDDYINDSEIGFGKEAWLGDEYESDDFVEAFFEEGRQYVRKGTYSLPFMKSSEVLYYNLDFLMEAMAIYKPELDNSEDQVKAFMKTCSWEDFMGICRVIKENKTGAFSDIEVPALYDSDSNFFVSKMFQNNIPYSSIGSDGKGHIDFEDEGNFEKAVQMVSTLKGYYDEGLFSTKGITGTYSNTAFNKEESVFCIGSTGGAGYTIPKGDAFELGVCPVPASNNNPLYVSQGVTLTLLKNPAYSAEENALRCKYGFKLMKYLTNAQVNTEMCIRGSEGYMPVRQSAYETKLFLDYMEEGEDYAQTLKTCIDDINGKYYNTATFPGSATLYDEVGGVFASVFKDGKDITETLKRAISNTKTKM